MYKTTSRNSVSRSYRSALAAKPARLSLRQNAKILLAKRIEKRVRVLATEPDLVAALGDGPQFILRIYRRYRHKFRELAYEPKRCSAYLNVVAGERMLDTSLWTDKAMESMFRCATLRESKVKCSRKS